MLSILDEFPYPWQRKIAQQLHITLCQISPTVRNTMLAAEQSGIDTSQIYSDQSIYLVWANILTFASAHGLLKGLINDICNRLNPSSPARPFLHDLLLNKPIILKAEPRGKDGQPAFIAGTDEIKDEEALLYRDDLTLQIGRIPLLINSLQLMLGLSPAICKLDVQINTEQQYGTGFRIGADLLLTNWHVLHNGSTGNQATGVIAEFVYEDDGVGGTLISQPIHCDVRTIISCKEDDWAVITVLESMDDKWPAIKISEGVEPKLLSSAFIIQHPLGNTKRIGFIRNQVSDFDDRLVHYLTDTEEGSSGSPVFNQDGELFALHHAGGRPQEKIGRPPMIKNEGIRISRIAQGLNNKGVSFL